MKPAWTGLFRYTRNRIEAFVAVLASDTHDALLWVLQHWKLPEEFKNISNISTNPVQYNYLKAITDLININFIEPVKRHQPLPSFTCPFQEDGYSQHVVLLASATNFITFVRLDPIMLILSVRQKEKWEF